MKHLIEEDGLAEHLVEFVEQFQTTLEATIRPAYEICMEDAKGTIDIGVEQAERMLSICGGTLVALPTEPPSTEAPETEVPETEAPVTSPPETAAPETEAPETETPVTSPPETAAPETQTPETEAPVTNPPETSAPETEAPTR